jgi:hypothetical protein
MGMLWAVLPLLPKKLNKPVPPATRAEQLEASRLRAAYKKYAEAGDWLAYEAEVERILSTPSELSAVVRTTGYGPPPTARNLPPDAQRLLIESTKAKRAHLREIDKVLAQKNKQVVDCTHALYPIDYGETYHDQHGLRCSRCHEYLAQR